MSAHIGEDSHVPYERYMADAEKASELVPAPEAGVETDPELDGRDDYDAQEQGEDGPVLRASIVIGGTLMRVDVIEVRDYMYLSTNAHPEPERAIAATFRYNGSLVVNGVMTFDELLVVGAETTPA